MDGGLGYFPTDPRRRMAILAERVKAMKVIWTEQEATFHGEHVSFEHIWRVNFWLPSARGESVELERCERAMSELLGT